MKKTVFIGVVSLLLTSRLYANPLSDFHIVERVIEPNGKIYQIFNDTTAKRYIFRRADGSISRTVFQTLTEIKGFLQTNNKKSSILQITKPLVQPVIHITQSPQKTQNTQITTQLTQEQARSVAKTIIDTISKQKTVQTPPVVVTTPPTPTRQVNTTTKAS